MASPPSPDPARDPAAAERWWLEHVYAGDGARQLTVRAVVTGMLLGGLMALSNLYVNLKTGWSLGVTITAAIFAFTIWSAICKLFPRLTPFGALENNAMQSVASAAGYMTGGGTVAGIGALMMITSYRFTPVTMAVWIACLAFLGVFVAIPLKRQLVNIEQLRFPTGLASAETVRSLHAYGGEARRQARALGLAGILGGVVAILRDALKLFPANLSLFGARAAMYTFTVEASLIMVGAGAIMGLRVALSQLAGAVLCYAVAVPWAVDQGGIVGELKYKTIVSWSVWFGAAMMLTAGLLQFALAWRTVKRAFVDLVLLFRPKTEVDRDDPLTRVEVPTTWFACGFTVFAPIAIFLQWFLFGIPAWMGVLTMLLSLVIAIVAARATGETDTTPSAAMGKLVQLIFGALQPGNMTTNLMTAQATAGVALHASDLLTDLKSGYILGAKPRHQFFAQFFGVIAGSFAVVPAFMILIPDASVLGTERFPAPACMAWAAVAKLLAQGLESIHWTARLAILVGGLLGILLVLVERFVPRSRKILPSPIAFGLAWTMPAWNSISMAAGSLIAFALERWRPALAAAFVIAVASGLIAGESLLGVFNGFLEAMR